MEYRTALFFLFLYYIRPQDWVTGITGMNVIRPMILLWAVSIFTSRTRPAVSGILRTPHDWAMLAYYVYVTWNSPDFSGTLKGFFPYVTFYALTVRSLTSWERVYGYLKFWNLMLVCVAMMAIASLYGLDLTGAKDATERMFGRLCIGTWLHNNPNSLAHSVIVVLPLSFVLYFWRGGLLGRTVIFPLCAAIACYCAYETESKGSFIVGGLLLVMVFVVGRPRPVQILALAMAATMGVSALSFLPRMEQMGNLRADAGVQGRLMVWEMARQSVEANPTGVGWGQFQGHIVWQGQTQGKATHSSYVHVGGDLGSYGLFFFLLPMWLGIRTFLSVHKLTREEPLQERCRRAGLLLLIAYLVSGWMINRQYHIEYFLLVALAASIHRLNLAEALSVQESMVSAANSLPVPADKTGEGEEEADPGRSILREWYEKGKTFWNRITVVDVGMGAAMVWAVLFTWDYILENL